MPDSRAPIAVTGACGFVGANIVLHLARHGRPVIACDIQPPPEPLRTAAARQPGAVRWVELDVTQEDRWAVLDSEPLAALIHGAAVTPGSADPTPARTAHVNLWGSIAGLEYARSRGGLRVVFLSSSAVYGIARSSRPLRVTRRVAPRTAYAASKLCAERFVSTYTAAYGLDACSARLAAIYGPWERPTGTRATPLLDLPAGHRRPAGSACGYQRDGHWPRLDLQRRHRGGRDPPRDHRPAALRSV